MTLIETKNPSEIHRQKQCCRRMAWVGAGLLALYLLLLLPERPAPRVPAADKNPFTWSQAEVWSGLQQRFIEARHLDPAARSNQVGQLLGETRRWLTSMRQGETTNLRWLELENNFFELSACAAADPARLPEYAALAHDLRQWVKRQSAHWDLAATPARERLYRLLYGGRMALEEVMLQNPEVATSLEAEQETEPSQTPSVVFRDVTLHSGDILVSRGGAPTSALISRGNDYPGSFSHVSLLHVDEATGVAHIIQALIEQGVVVTPLEEYARDRKLRLMVLRPRANLPALIADPFAPHRAASLALHEARTRPAPYDFAMNYRDHSALFCSEVVSAAYEPFGLRLWMGMSHISSPTVAAWLSSVGVRHFKTQEPADLEYDPQLSVVAERREVPALWQAHLDDAVTDVMLENAPSGQPLPYSHLKLPFGRMAKAWSVVLNWFGSLGPIPQGMSATTALRVAKYNADHAAIKQRLAMYASDFQKAHGYSPPYWELIRLATQAYGSYRANDPNCDARSTH